MDISHNETTGAPKNEEEIFEIIIRVTREELDEEDREKREKEKLERRINKRMTGPPRNAVSPNGDCFPFHCLFRCCARRVLLNDNRYYDIFCDNFVYTTDGRAFIGNYIGSEGIEDLDPFIMMPAEGFCCLCCYTECFEKWFESQFNAWINYNEEND